MLCLSRSLAKVKEGEAVSINTFNSAYNEFTRSSRDWIASGCDDFMHLRFCGKVKSLVVCTLHGSVLPKSCFRCFAPATIQVVYIIPIDPGLQVGQGQYEA